MDFFRSWSSYKAGFGSQESEFWLGNENLHQLTLQGKFPAGSRGIPMAFCGLRSPPTCVSHPQVPGNCEWS